MLTCAIYRLIMNAGIHRKWPSYGAKNEVKGLSDYAPRDYFLRSSILLNELSIRWNRVKTLLKRLNSYKTVSDVILHHDDLIITSSWFHYNVILTSASLAFRLLSIDFKMVCQNGYTIYSVQAGIKGQTEKEVTLSTRSFNACLNLASLDRLFQIRNNFMKLLSTNQYAIGLFLIGRYNECEHLIGWKHHRFIIKLKCWYKLKTET